MKAKGMQTNTKNATVVSKYFVTKSLKSWQDICGQTQKGLPKQEIKTRHSSLLHQTIIERRHSK